MTVVQPDTPEFLQLVDPEATLTEIGSGYVFTEGPVWSVAEQALYFSDIPGDKRFRWTESAGMELVMYPTFKGNGMAFDIEGRLIVCEHVSSSVTRFHADGFRETVCFHHERRLPQQPQRSRRQQRVTAASTSPIPTTAAGTTGSAASASRCSGSRACSACRTREARPQLVVDRDEFEQPNGLCFSPDESLMYVNDSPRAEVKVFDVADDGMLVNGRVLLAEMGGGTIDEGSVDGMECDEFGNVWVTGPGRRVGARARTGERHRHDRDARGVRQPVLGRARPAHAVPHHLDHGAHDADAVHLGAAPALRRWEDISS